MNHVSVQEAREILADEAINMTDLQISEMLSKMEDLVSGWLDNYETHKFGKTLNEILTS
jgi:hypothetical protein